MSPTHVCPSDVEARRHILEPLAPFSPAATRHARGMAGGVSYTSEQLDEAVREAHQRGVQEGKALIGEELLRVANAMSEAVRRAMDERRAAVQSLQHDAIGLSLAIARQVIMSELQANPDAIVNVLRTLLEEAEGRGVLRVAIHPDDLERVRNSDVWTTLTEAGIEMHPSAEIAPGGCVLDTDFGKLDGRLETRIEEIAAGLLGHVGSADSGEAEGPE